MSKDVKAKSMPGEYEIAHIWQRDSLSSGAEGSRQGLAVGSQKVQRSASPFDLNQSGPAKARGDRQC
jgi:hypothetical protein